MRRPYELGMSDASLVGRVHSLWRYPVKSMAGEELSAAHITPRGLLGDRAYALVDDRNKVGTARKLRGILDCTARFRTMPRADDAEPPPVDIRLPDGRNTASDDPASSAFLSDYFDHDVHLVCGAPEGVALEFAAGTLAGKHAETTEFPLASGAPPGTLVDYATLHILTTSALAELSRAHPEGRFDVRRFRPNIVLVCEDEGFVENGWLGRTLALGDEVRVQITIPCPRCVIPTLAQGELPKDPAILRTIVQRNRQDLGDFGELPCLGVCADVVTAGVIRIGDMARLSD